MDDEDQDSGYKNFRMKMIKCSLHLNIYLTFGFHIVVNQFPFANLFWILNQELKTWKIYSTCVDKYFGTWLLIKYLLNFLDILGQNLNIFVLLAIYIAMYDMQITSYNANLHFFLLMNS